MHLCIAKDAALCYAQSCGACRTCKAGGARGRGCGVLNMHMTYEEALRFIHGASGRGKKVGLENMRALLARLGNPHGQFRAIHVAGTNGKGSVCAFLNAALCCAGQRVGLYTSPFLQRYNERMRLNGAPIDDGVLADLTGEVADAVEALRAEGVLPTEFEIGTAIAFLFFARAGADIAVVEVGLGGRLDPTNVIVPQCAAIASIGLDHTRTLGDTVEAIAWEKAGIAKPGVPLFLSAQASPSVRSVIASHCEAVGAPFFMAPADVGLPLGLEGAHQRYNAALAVCALRALGIDETSIAEGLRRTRWPARLEWIGEKPPLLLDGAHNPQGAQSLADYVSTLPRRRTVLLCGVMQDKDWRGVARALRPLADAAVTVAPPDRRGLDAVALASAFEGIPSHACQSLEEAWDKARALAGPQGRVVGAGSLYLAGALRTLALGRDEALLLPEITKESPKGGARACSSISR